jgi:DNA-binding transcriptional ArsR family regulator
MSAAVTAESAALARFGRALGDPTRATMAIALLDGRRWKVGELADVAGVGAPTASDHVACLSDAGVVVVTREGRCTHVELACARVAETIELMTAGAADVVAPASSYRQVSERRRLAQARTCYDHLAGSLGVALHDAAASAGAITTSGSPAVPRGGRSWWADLGVDLDGVYAAKRVAVRECTDWTERRPHVAGALGAALCTKAFDAGWVRRADATRRVVVTAAGRDVFGGLGIGYAGTSDRWVANCVS